jgi:hypothetical protein
MRKDAFGCFCNALEFDIEQDEDVGRPILQKCMRQIQNSQFTA